MDRNPGCRYCNRYIGVALRKESVDRNVDMLFQFVGGVASLSARRAWLEIAVTVSKRGCRSSLSARRAWIEIFMGISDDSVQMGRSPQGERG